MTTVGNVNTVTGPVSPDKLGRTLMSESLLSIIPGARVAPEIEVDNSRIYPALRDALLEFADLGGGTIVDTGGLTMGRDVELYRLASEASGVHVVVATGFASQEYVGSAFWNPTSLSRIPPYRFPIDGIADIFTREVREGTVDPPRRRLAAAGSITVQASPDGITLFEQDVFRAAAQSARRTGAAVLVKCGRDPLGELQILLDEELVPEQLLVSQHVGDSASTNLDIVSRGMTVVVDHIGWGERAGTGGEDRRVESVIALAGTGHLDRVVLASDAAAVPIGYNVPPPTGFRSVLLDFVPALAKAGLDESQIATILEANPARLLDLARAGNTEGI